MQICDINVLYASICIRPEVKCEMCWVVGEIKLINLSSHNFGERVGNFSSQCQRQRAQESTIYEEL